MSAIYPLSEQELYEQAPSLFAPMPYKGASERYHFIPTIEVIERMPPERCGISLDGSGLKMPATGNGWRE